LHSTGRIEIHDGNTSHSAVYGLPASQVSTKCSKLIMWRSDALESRVYWLQLPRDWVIVCAQLAAMEWFRPPRRQKSLHSAAVDRQWNAGNCSYRVLKTCWKLDIVSNRVRSQPARFLSVLLCFDRRSRFQRLWALKLLAAGALPDHPELKIHRLGGLALKRCDKIIRCRVSLLNEMNDVGLVGDEIKTAVSPSSGSADRRFPRQAYQSSKAGAGHLDGVITAIPAKHQSGLCAGNRKSKERITNELVLWRRWRQHGRGIGFRRRHPDARSISCVAHSETTCKFCLPPKNRRKNVS